MSGVKPEGNESSRRRAFIISIVGGVTLLLLAVTVFAVSSQARSVSNQAEQAVRITEDLRVVSVSRAELSIASNVAALSPNQTEVLTDTLRNVEDALDAVEGNFDEQTPAIIREELAAYRNATDHQSELILAGTVDRQQTIDAEVDTGETFDRLATTLRNLQASALEDLRADNDLMNLISTIATFVVAFVVPSAALYIFEALRRAPRRARQMERAYKQATEGSLAMAQAVSNEATGLRKILDDLPAEQSVDALRRSTLRLEHVAALNGSVRSLHNTDVDLVKLAQEITRPIGQPVTIAADKIEDPVVHGDRGQFSLILTELIHNAVTHGSAPVRVEISTSGPVATMTVIDHGAGLPEVIEDAVVLDNDYGLRRNMRTGTYGFGLLAAREAAESLGGTLRYQREQGKTSLSVELPKNVVHA